MCPKHLHEITRVPPSRMRCLGQIHLANEEIASKHGEALGQSEFAVPQKTKKKILRAVPTERARKIIEKSDPGELKAGLEFDLARWQDDLPIGWDRG